MSEWKSDGVSLAGPPYLKIPYPVKGDHPIKMLVDRLYSFLEFKENPQTGQPTIDSSFPPGKRLLFVISRGDPEPPAFLPQFYDHLNEWLNLIPLSLGVQKYDFFINTGRTSTAWPPETTTRC